MTTYSSRLLPFYVQLKQAAQNYYEHTEPEFRCASELALCMHSILTVFVESNDFEDFATLQDSGFKDAFAANYEELYPLYAKRNPQTNEKMYLLFRCPVEETGDLPPSFFLKTFFDSVLHGFSDASFLCTIKRVQDTTAILNKIATTLHLDSVALAQELVLQARLQDPTFNVYSWRATQNQDLLERLSTARPNSGG